MKALCLSVLSAVLVIVFLYCYHVHSFDIITRSDSSNAKAADSSIWSQKAHLVGGLLSGHTLQLPSLLVPLPMQEETFTIVIQTYQRMVLLRKLLPHYCNMSCVDRILIVWNNVNVSVPRELSEMPCERAGLIFLPMQRNSVRNRFQPFPDIRTKGKQPKPRSCVRYNNGFYRYNVTECWNHPAAYMKIVTS